MKNIKLMNKIAAVGTNIFDKSVYSVSADAQNPDAIMVRSAVLHELEFNPELKAIARAGAGVNNIPIERCTESGIVVFNTPGANANGVKELAIAALLLAARDIVGGIDWVKTLEGTEGVAKAVEAGKSAFGGTEILGKTLGIVGLGAIGALLANAAVSLGMNVVGCDPYLSVEGALRIDPRVKKVNTFDELYKVSDYISLHVPATPETRGMICEATIAKMKQGVKIINLSRADLVKNADIKKAIEEGEVSRYVTDFPTEETVGVKGIINIPHLGASTEESEDNCAIMAANQLVDFLENGNIVNSVNYPALVAPKAASTRICIFHKGDVSAALASVLNELKVEIAASTTRFKGDVGYTVVDTNSAVGDDSAAQIKSATSAARVIVL